MALSHGIVTQDAPTSNGTQDFTKSSLGTVKGYIMLASEDTPANTDFADVQISVGASDLAAVNGFVIAGNYEDNVATSDSKTLINNNDLVYCATAGQDTATEAASHDSTITDGVRVDWTTTSSAVISSAILLKEGIDACNVQMVTLNGTGTTTVSGVGFNPDVVICISSGKTTQASSNTFRHGVQFYKQTSNAYAGYFVSGLNGDTTPDSSRHYTTAALGGNVSTTTGALDEEYTLSNFGADGFDCTKVAQTNAQVNIFISLKLASGYKASVGTVTAPASTGVTSLITGLDHTPQIALLGATGLTSSDTGDSNGANWMFGACDADAEVSIGGWIEDSGGATQNTNAGGHHRTDSCIYVDDVDGVGIRTQASFDSFQTDGVDLNFTTATNQVQIAYLTIGPDNTGAAPSIARGVGRGVGRGIGKGIL